MRTICQEHRNALRIQLTPCAKADIERNILASYLDLALTAELRQNKVATAFHRNSRLPFYSFSFKNSSRDNGNLHKFHPIIEDEEIVLPVLGWVSKLSFLLQTGWRFRVLNNKCKF
ncbi:hypothetical protein TNCV_3827831 [Trichonephila clavipes]|nr:hypothetical protein TNCV_3827831 [Trichonephila clavipes]